jgi:hypothetical protein
MNMMKPVQVFVLVFFITKKLLLKHTSSLHNHFRHYFINWQSHTILIKIL